MPIRRRLRAALALSAMLWTACGQAPPAALHVFQGSAMGTRYNVSVVAAKPLDGERLRAAVEGELNRVDRAMSTYRDDSELSRFNRHASTEPFLLSAETFAVFAAAQAVSEASGGAFDITVGPLVRAWGFGPAKPAAPPDPETIASLPASAGWEHLVLDPEQRSARKMLPGIECDLSAIAKGRAVDLAAEALSRLGHDNHLVEVGGEVRASGLNGAGKPWRIGIERPDGKGRGVQRILPLSGNAMATSGDYRNFREIDGKRYAHVIDPRSGLPAAHRAASVTVLHRSAMWADAYATALLTLGATAGLELAEREGLAALFLLRRADGGFDELASPAFDATIRAERP